MHAHKEPSNSGNPVSILVRSNKETILSRWKERLCRNIQAARLQSESELRDSIPKFLDRLADAINEQSHISFQVVNAVSEHHGDQRAQLTGYTLFEMLKEYALLREVIFEVLEEEGPLPRREREIILKSIELGMSEAGCRFMEHLEHREDYHRHEYRNLLDSIRDYGIIKTDLRGIITEWNVGAENIIGYSREEVLGRSSSIIFTHEDKVKNVFIQEMETAKRSGRAEHERWHLRKNGMLFYATGVVNPLYDENNRLEGFVKVIRDQTPIRLMEKELQKKRSEFEAIFHAIPDTVIVADTDRKIIACNPAMSKFFGYVPEEIIGRDTSIFYADEDDYKRQGIERYNALTRIDGTISYLARYRKKTGEVVISETNSSILRDETGKVTGYLAIMRDITERLKAEETLRQLADAMPQIVWTATKEGNLDYYNRRFFEYSDITYEQAKDSGWKSAIHPDDVRSTSAKWERAVVDKSIYIDEFRLRRRDGAYRWHLARAVPVENEYGEVTKWYGTSTEIHDQKESLDQLIEERELRDMFVSTLSHDLRTPLTSVKLSGQLIKRMYPENDKLSKSVDRILQGIERADSMIQDLLDANRIKAGEQIPIRPVLCELSPFINSTLEDLRHIHGDRFLLEDGVPGLEGFWDPLALRRVIENLCNNAVKYGDSEELITVKLFSGDRDTVQISVNNFGGIISPEEQKGLFSPFKRAASAVKSGARGWGIGLTIVQAIVQSHRGNVTVESFPELGTTFTIELPVDHRQS